MTPRPEFRAWWAEYPIRDFRPATIAIDHPEIGQVELEMFQFRPVEHPDMLMVLQVPRIPADLQRVTSLLARSDPAAKPPGPLTGTSDTSPARSTTLDWYER